MWVYDGKGEPQWDPARFEQGARGLLPDEEQAAFDENNSTAKINLFMLRKVLPLLERALKPTLVIEQ